MVVEFTSVHIAIKVVSSNPVHNEVYHYRYVLHKALQICIPQSTTDMYTTKHYRYVLHKALQICIPQRTTDMYYTKHYRYVYHKALIVQLCISVVLCVVHICSALCSTYL
jgi:hypothetical protein